MKRAKDVNKNAQKIQYGDFVTLSEMLGCTSQAARMRYERGDKKAKEALSIIIETRRKIIKEYKLQNQ
ncbi:hypothetical protein Ga0061079_103190 [Apibacter mensalis]|uniref:Uncharacterized protein n=1 Tax=Apibacter mensalis TaxID=1586267 RepID=A0A110BIB4_9FLAO|nr:hypothetical protein [Apibacter mensalis]CVK15879.1 hypothetical protein Ga0061079_103190 [Apibacter mensalis]